MGMPRAQSSFRGGPQRTRAQGPWARSVLGGAVIAAGGLASACAVAPPTQTPTSTQSVVYQQQAGYAQPPAPQGTGASANGRERFELPGLVEAAPRSVPDAVAQLDRAEQLLGFMLTPRAAAEVAKEPMTPAPPATSVASDAPVPLGDPCLIACAALASMRRSAEHVCTMAGDKDGACDSARARVERAEQRVTAACPACAANANRK